jgi:predicted ribosome quality control (RQC) complex YloA/Tae2 family protein
MYDALMLAAIVDELNDRLLDGKVQRTLLLDPLTFGFEVYTHGGRHQLLVSAGSSDARMHLVGAGDAPTRLTGDAARIRPLLLLLRKYVRGARLVRIYQESPLERVAFLRFAKFIPFDLPAADVEPTDEDEDDEVALDGELVETTLAVEIMGRHSNLILIDSAGQIIDSAKRIPSHLSRVRPVLPKRPYEPVPPQDKADPRQISPRDLAALLAANPDAQLQQALVNGLRGLSPQTAREVAFRATGAARTKAGVAQERVAAIRQALESPTLVMHDARHPNGENFYRFDALPPPFDRVYLKVCVRFTLLAPPGPWRGEVVTAYATSAIKSSEVQKWP